MFQATTRLLQPAGLSEVQANAKGPAHSAGPAVLLELTSGFEPETSCLPFRRSVLSPDVK